KYLVLKVEVEGKWPGRWGGPVDEDLLHLRARRRPGPGSSAGSDGGSTSTYSTSAPDDSVWCGTGLCAG
ncbi:hypothetical protein B7463_g12791, partial [Scytalidium lignicola]